MVSDVTIGSSPAAIANTMASVSSMDSDADAAADDDDDDNAVEEDADNPEATAADAGHAIEDGVHSQLLRKVGLVANVSHWSWVYVPNAPNNSTASHRSVNGTGPKLTNPRPSGSQTRCPAPHTLQGTKTGATGAGLIDGSVDGDKDDDGALLTEGDEEGSEDSLGSSDGAGEGMKLGELDGARLGRLDGIELGARLGVSLYLNFDKNKN